jgi:hypothetical protein
LLGTQFRKLRDHIMNLDPSSKYHSNHPGHRSVLKPKIPEAPCDDDVSKSDTSTTRSYKDALLGQGKGKK